jgi:hypothetical protein
MNKKYFSVKKPMSPSRLVFLNIYFFNFEQKIFLKIMKILKNILLFIYYIKFIPQSFDCIYFILNSFFLFFQFHSLNLI